MVPKAALVVCVFGIPKFVWFRTSKNSARNCTRALSRIRKFLSTEKSHWSKLGARNEFRPTFPYGFEHSYLARYLGFRLVQGGDLTVRDSRVFLKTLEGLKPVDVILRRVDDSFCDPIELRSNSYLGVAGLVEAVRAGNVAVANALGSGLIETSAFMPFLPGLSQRMLGEPLKLPAVATWWCGQPKAFDYVRDNLDCLVIKPAFPSKGMEPVFGGKLAAGERSRLLDRVRERPHEFVGQELLHLSTIPVWSEKTLSPRRVVLRVYLAAHGDSWVVMPGGLARVSSSLGTPVVSMQRGGGSKDTWVLTNGPLDTSSLQRPRDLDRKSTRLNSSHLGISYAV